MEPTFTFDAQLYLWKDDGSWVFVTVPLDVSEEIGDIVPDRAGFGSVKVGVRVGDTNWSTSVFPDAKSGCFVLPVKKDVRRAERIDVGDTVEIDLTVRID
ncbi:MAG: DUF1905 domain-containing protein [Actinomycetota bacterium]